jgi:hypothetical protein
MGTTTRMPPGSGVLRSMPRIGAKGPPIARVLPQLSSSSRLVEYGALDADPQDWFRVMRRADTGDTGPMIDLFADARDRDSHLDGVARKRTQSMMGRPIHFRPAEGLENDREANEIAKLVRRILLFESVDFRSELSHLMTGAVYSYAVGKLRWAVNAHGEYVPHIGWVHCNRFAFTQDTLELGFYCDAYRSHSNVKPLSNYPDCFVAHVPMGGRSDYPWRRGPMRSCIIPSFIKRKGLAFWLRLAERFGMPQPFATVPQGLDHDGQSSDDTVAVVEQALLGLSSHWAAVFSEGVKIDSIPGSGNVSAEVHKALIEWGNTTQSIAMLGQNLTTEVQGGSFAAAESHRFVAGDLHLADATELASTITQQVVEPLVRYNWPGAPVPVCEIGTGAKQVPGVDDVKEGIFSEDERRRMLGHEAKSDGSGKDYRRPVLVQVPAAVEAEPEVEEAAEAAETQAGDEIVTEPPAPDVAVAKDPAASLNGAQVDALKGIVSDVANGLIPRETGIELIVAAFPLSLEQAEKIMGSVGRGFVPKGNDAPPATAPLGTP